MLQCFATRVAIAILIDDAGERTWAFNRSGGAGSVFGSSETFAVKIISKVDSTNVPPSILICLLSKSKHVVLAYLFPNFVCYASNGVS